ncbi:MULTISPECIES: ethanolamine ammonia-lyase subunit EutC [Flavobacteriaceae]|uniref:ethanolamine ammonia-lyase subunit EutC n=1 Tax=Flavobacteriaceae TaxID=49546 RepID=UPI001490BAAE|nr:MULTISPECIES: ethanolamine ammonia-lyase subunit EutC [Allomuricauda]MDC6365412.1 ethanolamine ammonia-lyase subunit EutC [Muricauda sp. AC10]
MKKEKSTPAKIDPWQDLKEFTNARIALGSVGNAIPLEEVLQFRFAHAHAKDAIGSELDSVTLKTEIQSWGYPVWEVKSQVKNRNEYLRRPDLGRRLDAQSKSVLLEDKAPLDLIIVLADGLSAQAVNQNALPLLRALLTNLDGYSIGFVIARMARVALGDDIGSHLNARFVTLFIGERPGLSSPESMGIYTTYAPKLGLTDERRNCISNIHENGLDHQQAATLVRYLIQQSFAKQISGVEVKINLKELLED